MSALPITYLIRLAGEIDELRKEVHKAARQQEAIAEDSAEHTAKEFLDATGKLEDLNRQRREKEEELEGFFADAVSSAIDSLISQGRISNIACHVRAEG